MSRSDEHAPDGNRHLPVHGHRGQHAAARGSARRRTACALTRHDALLRQAVARARWRHLPDRWRGPARPSPARPQAARAALDAQLALQREPWGELGQIKVRMGAAHRRGRAPGRGVFRRAAASLRPVDGQRPRRADGALGGDGGAGPRGAPARRWARRTSASTACAIWPAPSASTSSSRRICRPTSRRSGRWTAVPNNLPPRRRAFIGREQQLQAVRASAAAPGHCGCSR